MLADGMVTLLSLVARQPNAFLGCSQSHHVRLVSRTRVQKKNVLGLNTIAINEFGGSSRAVWTMVVEPPSFNGKEY